MSAGGARPPSTRPRSSAASSSAVEHWPVGPLRPRLAAGHLDVWIVSLDQVEQGLLVLLDEQERAHAERVAHTRSARQWACSRSVLRDLLGRYTGCQATELRLLAGANGKPALQATQLSAHTEARPSRSPSFNLSHSEDVALYAFAAHDEVGIDVEVVRPARAQRDFTALAQRAFGQRHAIALQTLGEPQREREFLRMWTRHEAELKCLGSGIGGAEHPTAGSSQPWIAELDMGGRGAAAVACDTTPSRLRQWRWHPRARE